MASRSQAPLRTSGVEVRKLNPEEILGLAVFTFGVLAFVNLTISNSVPILTIFTGWVGPYFAAACMGSGVLLLYEDRLPNWRVTAMTGVILLMVALMAGTFIWQQPGVDWSFAMDGSNGGAVGRAFGNLLMEHVGRPVAGMIVWIVSLLGTYLLIRHSPLMAVPIWITSRLMHLLQIGAVPKSRDDAVATPEPTAKSQNSPHPTKIKEPPIQPPLIAEVSPLPIEPEAISQSNLAQEQDASSRPSAKQLPNTNSGKQSGPSHVESPLDDPVSQIESQVVKEEFEHLPPFELLSSFHGPELEETAEHYAERIENLYRDYGQPVEIVSIDTGPAVTRFGVKPLQVRSGDKYRPVRVRDVLALKEDMKMGLEAENLRFQAPVPGRNFIGIEVPNRQRQIVALREVLESPEFDRAPDGLRIAMGKDASGSDVVTDLVSAPHMLVCGATGTGKSTCINALLVSLLMLHGPDTLNIMLVDPKQIELTQFNGVPHLIGSVATSPTEVPTMLLWLIMEMEARYAQFRKVAVRDIAAFNRLARDRHNLEPLPYILLVIDELADLMLIGEDTIEERICRLAQKSRATGIHIVIATQRPSVDVLTGSIKANFPVRVAFAVSSSTDSRVVLDGPGAETLLGNGDMIFQSHGRSRQQRIQGSWVDEKDVKSVVTHWRKQTRTNPELAKVEPWRGSFESAPD